jgi:hypothetical protein
MPDTKNETKCPWCSYVSNAGRCAKSNVNKHVKYYAEKPADKRGNHPGKNDDAFYNFSRNRKFWTVTKSEGEKVARRAVVQKNYVSGKKIKESQTRYSKIYRALFQLKYLPNAGTSVPIFMIKLICQAGIQIWED